MRPSVRHRSAIACSSCGRAPTSQATKRCVPRRRREREGDAKGGGPSSAARWPGATAGPPLAGPHLA
eukprot:118837-Chlamydomonas_euryale.AAC.3